MIQRLYNYYLAPEIPEAAKKYHFIFVSDGDSLWACNSLYDNTGSASRSISPGDGIVYGKTQDRNAWEFSRSYDGSSHHAFTYSHIAGSSYISDVWVSRDIQNSNGTIVFRTSDRGFVEYGFWDGGEGDALGITEFTVPQGFHIAGTWKCIVSGTDSPVATMEWYRNDVRISTETGKSESACRPSADAVGTFTYKCVITFENGKSTTTGDMTMVVEAYDPGEDPGGGGDNPGGGGGGGDDETSVVTGIDLNVYPDTVVPGGHATIEVSVNGIGNYSKAFTARMSGHASSETELFSAGHSCNVWVAEEETAEYVLVTVTSVQDPNITATEMIYIDHSGTEDEGTTQEQLQKAFWKGFAAARAYFREAKVSGSIHIAREVAEPTTKEGKIRRSFWQGFVSAVIVTAGTIPAGVLVSSDGYTLKDSNGRYLCAKKQPVAVAYLYNGLQFPTLPQWENFSYVVMYEMKSLNMMCLYAFRNKPGTVEKTGFSSSGVYKYDALTSDGEWKAAHFDDGYADWYFTEEINTGGSAVSLDEIVWANFDIYKSDGTLYLAASDPIPVYE